MTETIYAVSSGAAPAAIAVLRVSGPIAATVATALAGAIPEPRRATLRRLRDADGATLDHALVLWFPGPDSAMGEDVLELHCHGGRAVIAAVERAIAALGARRAEAGEFTRRALLAGRIDLTQAAGLADLLAAETETERRAALAASEGGLSREIAGWLERLSACRAEIEAAIDYDEEGDVGGTPDATSLAALADEIARRLAAPTSERVREGLRVVVAGPPNAGKSSLFNAMLGKDAAIVAPIAGTTRDRIEGRVEREGRLFTLVDTAGLAEWTDNPIEAEGIRRSRQATATADLVLWMADGAPPPEIARVLWLHGRADRRGQGDPRQLAVSVTDPATIDRVWAAVVAAASAILPVTEPYLLHQAQREIVAAAQAELRSAIVTPDLLVRADHCRVAASRLGSLLGRDATEAMLDALFSRFCVGK